MARKIPVSEHGTICDKAMRLDGRIKNVALEYGVSSSCIEGILARYGLKRGHRKYELDLTYFERVDTPNKAYFLGLIYADGCNQRNAICISLQEQDGYLIERLKQEVGYTGSLYSIKRKKPHHKLRIGLELSSVKMANDISALGVVPNKSLVLTFPNFLSDALMSHFLRGYFDGDGSIYTTGSTLCCGLTSSPFFCNGCQEFLKKHLGIESVITTYPHSKACDVKISARQALIFLDYIYRDSEIKMNRKFDRFITFLESYNPVGNGGSGVSNERLDLIKTYWLESVGKSNDKPIGHTRQTRARSKYFGVERSKEKIFAKFRINGKRILLGTFKTEEGAARSYDAYCLKYALSKPLNFPNDNLELDTQFSERERCYISTPESRAKIGGSNRKTEIERYGEKEATRRKIARAGKRKGIKRGPPIPIEINGEIYPSMHAAAKKIGVHPSTIKRRYLLKICNRPIQFSTHTEST